MIEVNKLVKRYAGYEAVRGITFNVKKGEIVGFLGPNGAGKSTTMRILTGYLPATGGDVRIDGLNLLDQSLEVRRKIGYMPESVPLYPEMRVSDYLAYRAALKGVKSRAIKSRVNDVMDRCAVKDVGRKIIGNLSKGYKQRVGLADAMVHDPELLILDEPTAGLDPNQIRTVRDLIQDLGKDHTILLSTHILTEVEMVCSRAIIIHKGRIEASDSLENLRRMVRSGLLTLEVKAAAAEVKAKLEGLDTVGQVEAAGTEQEWSRFEVVAKPGQDLREQVDRLVKESGWPLREFHYAKATLEDVFVELTQE
jgi:ABC-2 type transport system ATP-binding protein